MQRQPLRFYSAPLPGIDTDDLSGKFIVIEGAASAGCSTQVECLKLWLEKEGHAVLCSRPGESLLAAKGIRRAEESGLLQPCARTLFYAADLADRLENDILPALRSGFVVLADRYIYSLMANAAAGGENSKWIEKVLGFALAPHAAYFLEAEMPNLVARKTATGAWFDYDKFVKQQSRVIRELQSMAARYAFEVIDANRTPEVISSELQERIPVTQAAPLHPFAGRTRRSSSPVRSA
jgi:dTMP kinase